MGKIYLTRWTARLIAICGTLLMAAGTMHAQSMNCHGGLQASLDDSCKVVIQARTILTSVDAAYDSSDYEITVTAKEGNDLSGVYYNGPGDTLKLGNVGSIITFTAPGSFTISVKNKASGNYCWSNLSIEDKLPPKLVENTCNCPDDATSVSDDCTFSCASMDQIYNKKDFYISYDSIYRCLEQEKRFTGEFKLARFVNHQGDTIWSSVPVYDWVCVKDTSYRVPAGLSDCSMLPSPTKVTNSGQPLVSKSLAPRCVKEAIKINVSRTQNLNPEYYDNCGDLGEIFCRDRIVETEICGEWYLYRDWYTKIKTGHGEQVKQLACSQKFLFKKMEDSDIRAPKRKVILECQTETTPEALRKHFSNNPQPNQHDSTAIYCSAPYTVDVMPDGDTLYLPLGVRKSSIEQHCKVLTTYTDSKKIFPDPGCKHHYKFVRTWKMVDWCTGRTRVENQIIALEDNEAPEFTISDTLSMGSTNPWKCYGAFPVPAPVDSTFKDNCSPRSEITWRAIIKQGAHNSIIANRQNGYTLNGLSKGEYHVVYEVSDACGNTAFDTSYLKIVDRSAPNVVTKNKVIATFTDFEGSCVTKIYPHNIDVGTFDACDKSVDLAVRRLGDTLWADFVKFTEKDLTGISPEGIPYGEVQVELQATDDDGNSSIGWSTVRLEDKNSRLLVDCGRDNIHLDCSVDFDLAIDSLYAPVAIMRSCDDNRIKLDRRIVEDNFNRSCNAGHARVVYSLPGSLDTLCIKDFYINSTDSVKINWPAEEIIVTCDVSEYPNPVVSGGSCNSLAHSVEEQVFDANSGLGYCKKIIRRHTIIDWCVYNANSTRKTGLYTFTQVIKVKDDIKPTVTCTTQTFSAGSECGMSGIQLEATAVDSGSCAEQISWAARIDTDGDDKYDLELTPLVTDDGKARVTVDTLLSTGTYKVWWRATDGCNNSTDEICSFTITDDKAPQPQCIAAISTALMNTNGEVAIWAKDFDIDGKSIDECGGQLTYSFSGTDRNVSSMTFTCDDIENGVSQIFDIRVYVWDVSGNNDFCSVQVRVEDNSDVCLDVDEGSALISGHIQTENGDNLESAEVMARDMKSSGEAMKSTDTDGKYAFTSTPANRDYAISASKYDNPGNGVSTLDIIKIRQHILATRTFDSPYKVIAADVSGDERISGIDIVEIRKVILGVSDEFRSGKSWTFVPADATFADPLSPWPVADHIELGELSAHQRDVDFVAIKLGDVNGNAIANSAMASVRSSEYTHVTLIDEAIPADVETTASLELIQSDARGLQVALRYDGIAINGVKINGKELSSELYRITDSHVILSVDDITSDEVSIDLSILADKAINLADALSIDAEMVSPELYHGDELIATQLALTIEQQVEDDFSLYQNKPNPFADETTIEYHLSVAGDIELSIFNMAGELLMHRRAKGYQGMNEIKVDLSDLPDTGVLYYQLSSGDQVATRPMIRL